MRHSLLLVFIFLSGIIYSQQYNFISYGVESGLPQSTVYDIFQDSRGYLWFGTDGGGLAKFDGIKYKVYNKNSGLSGNVVRKIIEDSLGNLWIGTDEGISVFDGRMFHVISEDSELSGNIIVSLFADDEGIIWAGTSGNGLCRIVNMPDGSFTVKSYGTKDYLGSNNIFDIYKDHFNRLWIATFGGGINIITFIDDSITDISYLNTNNGLPSDLLFDFEPADNNILWVSSYDNGAFSIQIAKDINKPVIAHYNTSNFLKDNRIWSIHAGEKVWFATDKSGLNVLNKNGNLNYFSSDNGLPKDQVIKVFQDNEGSIWFSIFDKGVFRFLGEQFIQLTEKEGLDYKDVNDIHILNNDEILLATDGGGIYRMPDRNCLDKIKRVKWNNRIPVNSINDIESDQFNNIWMATEAGIYKYNSGNISLFNENKGLINNRVNCLYNDKNNILWCGTVTGISKIINDKIYNADLGEGLINEVQTIIEDVDGNIWCGTLNGLVKFDNDIATIFDEVEGLQEKKINCLISDKGGNIWIGTFGNGIFLLKKKQETANRIILFANDSLLNSNNINILAFKNKNTILAGTDKGLNEIIIDDSLRILQVIQFDNTNGFSAIETNKNSLAVIDNTFWFGTSNGVTIYRPEFDIATSTLPLLHITGLKLQLEEVNWAEKTEKYLSWYNLPVNLELSYKDNHLSVSYIGLYYRNPSKILYKYRLLGLTDKWTEPSKTTEEQYPGLQPGKYTFEVMACNEYNQWIEKPVQFSFYIKPPFWKTIWFYLICAVFVVIVLVIYVKYREKILIQEKERLELIVAERTSEVLEQKKEIEYKNSQITDSIRYAKRIQEALLSSEEVLKKSINEYFIFYRPRDIVSGDFYWMTAINKKLIVAAADCTGHGVPGAFMSMLGISFLNEIIGKNQVTDTSEILNMLRKSVIDALKQKGQIGGSKDGMDIAICSIDLNTKKLQFSGAQNPLFLIRNGILTEIKADKMPIAYYEIMEPFKKEEIEIQENDLIYLFSDGYVDQFGGPRGKKFMKEHFKELLIQNSKYPLEQQKDIISNRFAEWKGDSQQIDDVVVLGLKI